jgi:hypothetical protein
MIVAVLILVLSTAMFFFYFQATCQKILRTQFDREYFRSVARAHGLEFLGLCTSLGDAGAVDYRRLSKALKCDYLALTYLLRNVANAKQRYSNKERLLMVYFRWLFVSLAARRLVNLGEKRAILRLTSILQYFANVVGQRTDTVGFATVPAADYVPNR